MIHEETGRPGHGIVAGLIAGVVGIGCCVGPAVAALTGIMSAAVAIDLANSLYSEWGWAFKLAGLASGAMAIGLMLRSRRGCRTRSLGFFRYALIVTVTGVANYGALYGFTRWLGGLGESSNAAFAQPQPTTLQPVRVGGRGVESRVASALEQITSRYPSVELSIAGLSQRRRAREDMVETAGRNPSGRVTPRSFARRSRILVKRRSFCCRRSLERTQASITSVPLRIGPSFRPGAESRCSRPATHDSSGLSRVFPSFSSTPRGRPVTSPYSTGRMTK